ncbi:thyroid receptor-interacting protein 11 [Sabethes cyaneus]|uniref:thyroid receptor-interacting protein 11 n=1 Tax=Sabethes cyaneus TaxID=53552 RepID=UPI00237ECBD8|nr:thyroid receptor-interacting protein 11 [Sabethes cyaneus]
MSWLKLNDSLSKVKGQITSFAQEVLAEGIVNESEQQDEAAGRFNPIVELDQAQEKVKQLTGLCATQDQEIATLRKQIAEYQQQLQCQRQSPKPPTELPASGSKLLDQHGASSSAAVGGSAAAASALEDSWFWDPEQNVSSTSSSSKKGDENDSPHSGADLTLTTIPLEAPATEGEIIERLHRQLADRRQQLKKQQLENALLAEKLTQVTNENRELNENIEELDRQHELVVENLLTVKKGLQEKCIQLEEELRVKQGEASVAQELDELRKKHKLLEQSYGQSCHEGVRMKTELERIVVDNVDTVGALENEIDQLKKSLQVVEDRLHDSIDAADQKINTLTVEKSDLEERFSMLRDEADTFKNKLQEAENKCENFHKLEADYDNLKDELDELRQKAENDAFVALQKEDQADLEELRKNFQEQQNEVERWKSDCDRLQEDNLILQRNEEGLQTKLALLQSRLREQEERQSTDEQQIKQLQREVNELQNELRSVIIDNSVQLDAKEKEWQERLNFLKEENCRILHSKDTLEADLMQYEKECANLMKNNDLLIAEIDNLKSKKLETINENAEDSIVILEKQLEDCSMLNKNLEDEYQEVNKKLEEVLEEREELDSKVESLQKTLKERTQTINDLRLNVESLENEKSNLRFEITEAQTRSTQLDVGEQLAASRAEAESLQAQLTTINEDHASLVLKLQQLQQTSVENVKLWETKVSEMEAALLAKESVIKQLREELQNKVEEIMEIKDSSEKSSEDRIKLIQDRLSAESQKSTILATEKDEIENRLKLKLDEINQLRIDYEQLSQTTSDKLAEQQSSIDTLTQQKDDLVQLITVKHNESVQYHAEIQRLSQLLQKEPAVPSECQQCATLRERIVSLEAQTGKLEDFDRMTDQIQFLREKSDILTNNLLIEQNNQKLVQQEKHDLIEQKNSLARDLERLRHHLLEIEEAHTQETVELQQRYDETRLKLQTLEEEVKNSTNALTSASIRASQHAETLQTQYHLLQQQRDELVAKLNAADDRDQRNLASLTNLQCALEQFQINKDRDIELATTAIRREVEQAQARENALKADIRQLQHQLGDAKNGLLAAARISDQLEIAQVTVATLKDELARNNEKYQTLEGRLLATEASQADKVEKTLVKNLVIGYIVAPNQNDKHQILKLISAVLTMDQTECVKIGLNRTGGGWFNSILGSGPSPQSVNNYNKESLTEAFVKFLEKESTPRQTHSAGSGLLNIMTHERQPTATSSSRINTPVPQQPSLQQTTDQNLNPVPVTTSATVVQPVQPILLGEASLLQQAGFQPARSSSSILKDILSDS